jgi:hypothetical protein
MHPIKQAMGPIRIRVVCGDEWKHSLMENVDDIEDKENQVLSETKRRGPKRKVIKAALQFSSPNPSQAKSNDANAKQTVSVLTEDRLKLESLVLQLSGEIKRKDEEARYLRKQIQPFILSENTNLHLQFKAGIDRLVATIFPGKHNATKAFILMNIIKDNLLFNGEAALSLRQHTVGHIKTLFRAWKLVKAGDTSPVGAFKTSTIEALHNVIDEDNDGLFPNLKR